MSSESAETQSGNPVARTVGFFRESVDELKKVTHPTRQETTQATIVTLLIMFFVSICLFLFDWICTQIMNFVLP